MKKFFSILFLFLSVLGSASPLLDINCMEAEMTCTMEKTTAEPMSCCDTTGTTNTDSHPMDMMCCIAPRVVVSNVDLQTQETEVVAVAKAKKAAVIRTKWFNSNYLTDLKSVDVASVTPTTIDTDGYKYERLDRLSYICTYRI